MLGGPRERGLEPHARLLALAIDVRSPVVRARGQDRREHVEFDAAVNGSDAVRAATFAAFLAAAQRDGGRSLLRALSPLVQGRSGATRP
jgi:hypothetical protein